MFLESPLNDAVSVAICLIGMPAPLAEAVVPLEAVAVVENAAVVEPLTTVTDGGTDSCELLLESEIVVPALGAALLSVTEQLAVDPVFKFVGLHANEVSV
jgi:hypothetical protein